ncbi:MAG TPA: TM0106 family RecB-like putative nuclease [Acidimicrobiales bacterium]|nr:TM0106 family RecB-like putative nuclease [Acidimicrobiales bacterium]
MVTIAIRPKDSSFAKACPERVQLDVLRPCEPAPDSPFLQKLIRAGQEHEGETIGGLFDDVVGAVVIDADDPDAREWHTLHAVAQGARIVAGGRLPADYDGHRVGEPDLLVRHGDGYLPVDVKSHKSLERARRAGTGTALVSEVAAPLFELAAADTEHTPRRHLGDVLQLAHYRRLLEAAGLAPTEGNVGGICGSEGVVVWYDLDAQTLDPPEHVPAAPAGPVSAMERYELEFAHRLGVVQAAEAHVDDETAPLLAEPIVCAQCDMCRWRDWCGERLEEAADLSLISGVAVARRQLYKAHGIDDLVGLAALDWTTAELVRRGVDVAGLTAQVRDLPATTPLDGVIPKRKKQLDDLAALGFVTVGDLAVLDPGTLELCAAGASNLATHIELARARVGPSPAYRQRAGAAIGVLRGDIEVDLDMESTNDGCYLWGALVNDRRAGASAARYVAFATWDPDLEAGELAAFETFWSWFSDLRDRARSEGASFRAYCYSKSAEQGQMARVADRLGRRDEVDAFWASDEWVDLLEVVRAQLVTGRSMGLKETAPLAGFAWRFDDAGGSLAMVKYDQAVDEEADPDGAAGARQWILGYNEDDVRATFALRDWLDGPAVELPSIAQAPS